MGKALLLSVVFVPILIGMFAASLRRARRGLALVVAGHLAFAAAYAVFLYYVYLRIR